MIATYRPSVGGGLRALTQAAAGPLTGYDSSHHHTTKKQVPKQSSHGVPAGRDRERIPSATQQRVRHMESTPKLVRLPVSSGLQLRETLLHVGSSVRGLSEYRRTVCGEQHDENGVGLFLNLENQIIRDGKVEGQSQYFRPIFQGA